MNLSEFTVLDAYGIERIPLTGDHTADTLAEIFIETWIPYFECHKCGRWDYCKFAKPHPANPNRSVDIKCGVAVDCIRNFVHATFCILEEMDKGMVQNYLDGAYHFYRFVHEAEGYIGMCMDSGFREDWGEYSPMLYGRMIHLRDRINELTSLFKHIPAFRSIKPVLFVEGYAEKEFLNELKKSHLSTFLHLITEVYGGSGNRRLNRIKMLLEKYNQQGYKIYIQGDADGKSTDIFNNLIKSNLTSNEKVFVFRHDFESAFPRKLLYFTLKEMDFLGGVSIETFINTMNAEDISVIKRLDDLFGIDISPHKIELANMAAKILNYSNFVWWRDEAFLSSELGRFLQFIQKI